MKRAVKLVDVVIEVLFYLRFVSSERWSLFNATVTRKATVSGGDSVWVQQISKQVEDFICFSTCFHIKQIPNNHIFCYYLTVLFPTQFALHLLEIYPSLVLWECVAEYALMCICTDDDNGSYRNVSFSLAMIFIIIRLFGTSTFRVPVLQRTCSTCRFRWHWFCNVLNASEVSLHIYRKRFCKISEFLTILSSTVMNNPTVFRTTVLFRRWEVGGVEAVIHDDGTVMETITDSPLTKADVRVSEFIAALIEKYDFLRGKLFWEMVRAKTGKSLRKPGSRNARYTWVRSRESGEDWTECRTVRVWFWCAPFSANAMSAKWNTADYCLFSLLDSKLKLIRQLRNKKNENRLLQSFDYTDNFTLTFNTCIYLVISIHEHNLISEVVNCLRRPSAARSSDSEYLKPDSNVWKHLDFQYHGKAIQYHGKAT